MGVTLTRPAGVGSAQITDGSITLADLDTLARQQIAALYTGATFGPGDAGFKAWNFDPVQCEGNFQLTTGRANFIRVRLGSAQTLTGVAFFLVTNGATLTAGQSFAGLYDTAGNRLALSADQSTAWTSGQGDNKQTAFTATYAAAAGDYFVGLLSVGTTMPIIGRADNTRSNSNGILTTPIASLRYCRTSATNLTALPATIDFAAAGQITGPGTWIALY